MWAVDVETSSATSEDEGGSPSATTTKASSRSTAAAETGAGKTASTAHCGCDTRGSPGGSPCAQSYSAGSDRTRCDGPGRSGRCTPGSALHFAFAHALLEFVGAHAEHVRSRIVAGEGN